MQHLLKMFIHSELEGFYYIEISSDTESVRIAFNPQLKSLKFMEDSPLSMLLRSHEHQFRKLLHNKRPDTYYIGFELVFSLIDQKDIEAFNNRDNIIALYNGNVEVYARSQKKSLDEVYTDGSYREKEDQGAFGIVYKDQEGNYDTISRTTSSRSSSEIELEAVIYALETYSGDLRVITDSQYVRKGITEWVYHWKCNGWRTANGTEAKNKDLWLQLERLCSKRYIEFMWVKAHNNQFENEYCDLLAKDPQP